MTSSLPDDAPRPRLCHLRKWPDFNGYGFNLHAEKGTAGQFIGSVDEESPCDAAGLRVGDRIIEVNGINIGSENHQQVVTRIKAVPNETKLLVIDSEGEEYYKSRMIVITGDMENIMYLETPVENPYTMNKRDTDDDDDGGEAEDASNKIGETNNNEDSDAQDSPDVSHDYKTPSYKNDGSSDDNDLAGSKEYTWQKQEPEPEKIVTPIVTPSPTYSHNSQPSYDSKPSSASDAAKPSSDKEHTLPSNASSVSAASSGRSSGGLEFAGSAREARERMSKKRNVKEGCMTLKDKYDLLQKL